MVRGGQMEKMKKLSIVIVLIFIVGTMCSGEVMAVGQAFSDADEFLSKRRPSIKQNKWNTIDRNIKFYV